MRRRNRNASLIAKMIKSTTERLNGRIHWQSNMWAIQGSRWDKNRIVNESIAGQESQSGTRGSAEGHILHGDLVLVAKQCTRCPKPPGDGFAKSDQHEFWYVPATECRKCPLHRMGNGKPRYPTCSFRASGNPQKDTENVVTGIIDKAVEMVKEITGDGQ